MQDKFKIILVQDLSIMIKLYYKKTKDNSIIRISTWIPSFCISLSSSKYSIIKDIISMHNKCVFRYNNNISRKSMHKG